MWQSPTSDTYNSEWNWLPFYQWKKEFWEVYPTPEVWCSEPIKIVEKWDILISVRAPVWPTNLCNETSCIGRWLAWIRPKLEILELWYLRYYFKKYETEISELGKWSTFASITKSDLETLEIPLPPLSTQSRIVARLDEAFASIDEQIALIRTNIEDVDNMRKSLVETVFTWNESTVIQKLVQKTETWNPISIGDNTFEYIDIASIDNTQYILTETKSIIGKDAPSRAKKLVKENDIIFATTRPNLKNIAIIDRNLGNLTCSTGFCVLRVKSELLSFRYLFYYLISDIVADKISPMIRWAGYPAISDKDLLSIDIPLPPLDIQHSIVAHLDSIFATSEAMTREYEAQMADLETLKQSLLREAFEGRIVAED